MKFSKAKLLLFAISAVSIVFFSACSRNNTPEPPHLKTELISELFAALRQENWEVALDKIKRIRELSPDNSALSGIEYTVQNNITIQKAQKKLDNGDIDGAIKIINDFTEVNGQTLEFRNAIKELNTLRDIKTLVEAASKESYSQDLAYSVAKLNKAINDYPDASSLQPFADKSFLRAHSLKEKENFLALEDLRADIDIAYLKHPSELDTLMAIFTIANPNDDLSLGYREALSQNWDSLSFSENYFDPNLEFILFRKILLSPNDAKTKQAMLKLVSLEPNNYRSLAIKGFLLNLLGKTDDSMKILTQLQSDLNISDEEFNSWFNLSDINIGFNKLNPFVLYPFFIYISQETNLINKPITE